MPFHGVSQRCSSTVRHNGDVLRCDPTPHLRQHFNPISSPESEARHAWVTLPSIFVARECSTARLGDTSEHFRRPRVQHDTLGQHCRAFSSPESAARHAWATLSRIFVARGCSTTRLGDTSEHFRHPRVQHDTLGQHCRAFSSPESKVRHAWVTLLSIIDAQRCKAE